MAFRANNAIKEGIRRQSPMLWLAVPLALGIAAAECLGLSGTPAKLFFIGALLFAALCGHLLIYEKEGLAKYAFVLFAFCIGAFFYTHRVPPDPYPEWNTREATLTLNIERADRNVKNSSYGFGRVIAAPEYFANAKGSRIWFYVKDNPDISRGDTITGMFTVRKVVGKEGFDAYLNSQKIYFNASSQLEVDIQNGGFPYSLYNAVRGYITRKLSALPSEEHALSSGAKAYRAMILGDKGLLDADAKTSFQSTGTMHIFAISGLHVGLIAAVIYGILNILRLPRKSRPFICLPLLFLYVNACGARPSAMRAFMMIALIWVAISLVRKPKPFAGFVAAFTISLLLKPSDLFDAGFALSYSVVAAILLYAVPLIDAIKAKTRSPFYDENERPGLFRKSADYLIAAFAISFSALFASAPLGSAYFGYIAPLALPFSIVYVAAASVVVGLGVIAMILPDFIVQYTNMGAAFITSYMLDGASFGASTGIVINLKISGTAAFLIECTLISTLLFAYKIPGIWKWFIFPAVSVVGIFIASL